MANNKEWKEFFIGGNEGLFNITASASGIDKIKLNFAGPEEVPYITRSGLNNGYDLFVSEKQANEYKIDKGGVITIGLDTQTVFYQPYRFFTGQNIQVLRHPKLNKHVALFLIPLLKIQMEKFNWGGNGATLGRLSRTKIMLPINEQKEPDFEYMESSIRELRAELFAKYEELCNNTIKELKPKPIKTLEEKEWREFFIHSLFRVKSGVRLTRQNQLPGKRPFIGATEYNNGITNFVSNKNNSLDRNVLGVNYNGSVVENFYHPYEAVFSDDVKRLELLNYAGNRHIYLFFKAIILQQKSKYQYAYKFNSTRMLRQKILVPVNKAGEPDYAYMEQYMINMEYVKRKRYLEYRKTKK